MVSKAQYRYLPASPRKVRLVAREIRGRAVPEALALLANLPRGACGPLAKTLKSALANAVRAGTYTEEQLFISRILCDQGPSMKRFRSAPMGRANPIQKRLCHLTIELDVKRKSNGS